MRLITKKIAALASLISSIGYCRNTVASCWLASLLVIFGFLIPTDIAVAATEPDTVLTNKVMVNYTVGNGATIVKASSVSLTTSSRTPAQIKFYSNFVGGETLNVQPTMFSPDGTGSNWQPLSSNIQGSTELIQTVSFSVGEPLVVRVEDYDQNVDATVFETIIIDLGISNTGDAERLLLTETAADSGVFVGVVELVDTSLNTNNDGALSVEELSEISAKYTDREDETDTAATVGIVDPSNIVFDSSTGEPINGATITLVYTGTSQGARVYDQFNGDWPSTVVSGAPVVASSSSRNLAMGQGEFQFPRVLNGEYELRVIPPVGYRFPSQQSQTQLALLGDIANQVNIGSKGEEFSIADALGAVLLNIPLDRFNGRFSVQKVVDKNIASTGDELVYTVIAQNNDPIYALPDVILKDTLPPGFRYIAGSAMTSSGFALSEDNLIIDGRNLTFSLGTLIAGTSQKISYRVAVGAGTPSDEAVNTVQGFSDDVESNIASATVEMRDELMRTKNILIGRVFSGDCENPEQQQAIKNARIYVDNGRTVVTDKNGRWHLEGLRPGAHAIQLDESSLPTGMIASPCHMTSRNVKQPHSQIINLHQGQIWRADFHVETSEAKLQSAMQLQTSKGEDYKLPFNPLTNFDKQYIEKATGEFEIVWPPEGHVPPLSTMKVAVKYPPKNKLKLLLNGEEVSAINLDGSSTNRAKTATVKRWTGVDINQKNNNLIAILQDSSGKEIKRVNRYIHFTQRSVEASLVPESSVLVADGVNTPVIALKLIDEDGFLPRPRSFGSFTLNQNHWRVIGNGGDEANDSIDLNKPQNGKYKYKVSDDGLVRIKLEPTVRSGHININLELAEGQKTVKAWLAPSLRDWIMVGFASGTVGHNTLSGNMQTLSDLDQAEGLFTDSQISFFAKGRIKGDYLLTIAYDSNKQKGEVGEQLNGVIDPQAWYTLYGDEQQQQYETPSSSKLYLKLEKDQFYAMFGDYATGLDVTELGRYERVLHGLKSSYEGEKIQYTAFASETNRSSQRDEVQGDGTSGLYYLSRAPVTNSEKISIETRDRDDLGSVLSSRTLSRHTDYELDYDAKTLFFKFPVSGSDDEFNPIFIVAEYESDEDSAEKTLVVGGRVGMKALDDRLKVGATYVREGDDQLAGVDAQYDLNDNIILSAEAARSETDIEADAWKAEVEYRDEKWNARAFAKQQETGFGLNQQSTITEGERSSGVTARYKMTEEQTIVAALSLLEKLENEDQRRKSSIAWEAKGKNAQLSVGYQQTEEQMAGETTESDSLRIGASKSFLDGKFNLSGQLEKALNSDDNAEQNPDRFKLGVDYKLSEKVSLFAEQELLRNDLTKQSNTRVGLKSNVWEGGNLRTDLVQDNNDVEVGGSRNYAVLGLSQHWKVNDQLSLDFNIDKSKTIKWLDYTPLSDSSTTTINSDDYLSVSIGAGWNHKEWSATARAEYRESDASTRRSLQYKAMRKLGEHYAVSKLARVIETEQANGDSKRQSKFSFSAAMRSKNYNFTLLNQLDYQNDVSVSAGVKSRASKFINNLHYNHKLGKKLELSLHHGTKLTQNESTPDDWGVTDTLQLGARYDISESWDVGAQAGYLHHWDTQTRSDFAGLSVGFSPTRNTRLELGYNMHGFDDDDFENENYTHNGPYININYLLDQSLLKVFDRKEEQ